MKRTVVLIILVSMVVHCASRIGLLSYLYSSRHSIAYQIGMISEIPIALCSSDYDFGTGLTIVQHGEGDSMIPPVLAQAREIILITQEVGLKLERRLHFVSSIHSTAVVQSTYSTPFASIFRPPCWVL